MLAATKEMFESFGGADAASLSGGGTTTLTGTTTRTLAPPSAAMILTLIITPLVMIGLGTVAATVLPAGTLARDILGFIGAPIFALLVTVVLAGFFLGTRRGGRVRTCPTSSSPRFRLRRS